MIGVTAYAVKDAPICRACLDAGALGVHFRRIDDARGQWIALCQSCADGLRGHIDAFVPRATPLVTWHSGPPPGRGAWWIVIACSARRPMVIPVDISPALIHWNNPDAPLLIKTLGGGAHAFVGFEGITHHAALNPPEAPMTRLLTVDEVCP